MPIRLIDPNAEIKIVIQGTTFVTKPLDAGQVISLTRANERLINGCVPSRKSQKEEDGMQDSRSDVSVSSYNLDGGTENFEAVVAIVASVIQSIDLADIVSPEGGDPEYSDILRRMYLTDFMDLIVKIINASTVNEDESKN